LLREQKNGGRSARFRTMVLVLGQTAESWKLRRKGQSHSTSISWRNVLGKVQTLQASGYKTSVQRQPDSTKHHVSSCTNNWEMARDTKETWRQRTLRAKPPESTQHFFQVLPRSCPQPLILPMCIKSYPQTKHQLSTVLKLALRVARAVGPAALWPCMERS
jgi:hypothetical protein